MCVCACVHLFLVKRETSNPWSFFVSGFRAGNGVWCFVSVWESSESSALACVARLIDQLFIYSQLFRCVGTILQLHNDIEHDTALMLKRTYHNLGFNIV
jgi:hypothetical protein